MKVVCQATVLLLGVLVHTSEAVDCYECRTPTSMDCGDPYTPRGLHVERDCNYCSKMKSVVKGAQEVKRKCITIGTPRYHGCESKEGEITCFCDSDMCNGACHVTMTFTSLLGVIFVYSLMSILFNV